jgi:hypothetical protein
VKIYVNGLTPGDGDEDERLNEDQIKICTAWLMLHAIPTARLSRRTNSYSYKHRVERWTHATGPHRLSDLDGNRWTSSYYYISNGAFIEAARRIGYRVEPTHAGSPNAHFNFRVKPEVRR